MSGEGAGTYAGSAVLTAWARMPQGLTFQEAAGYPSVVETAPHVLREVGVEAGQTLPVSGASGEPVRRCSRSPATAAAR